MLDDFDFFGVEGVIVLLAALILITFHNLICIYDKRGLNIFILRSPSLQIFLLLATTYYAHEQFDHAHVPSHALFLHRACHTASYPSPAQFAL